MCPDCMWSKGHISLQEYRKPHRRCLYEICERNIISLCLVVSMQDFWCKFLGWLDTVIVISHRDKNIWHLQLRGEEFNFGSWFSEGLVHGQLTPFRIGMVERRGGGNVPSAWQPGSGDRGGTGTEHTPRPSTQWLSLCLAYFLIWDFWGTFRI